MNWAKVYGSPFCAASMALDGLDPSIQTSGIVVIIGAAVSPWYGWESGRESVK